jgi:hypothetical protein
MANPSLAYVCGFGHHVRDASKTLCGGIRDITR